jgi:hypothetical protein
MLQEAQGWKAVGDVWGDGVGRCVAAEGGAHPSFVNPSAMMPGHYRIRVSQ